MTTTVLGDDNDDLRRIADALERIANHYAPAQDQSTVHITAPPKSDLAQQIIRAIREQQDKGTLPKNWNAA